MIGGTRISRLEPGSLVAENFEYTDFSILGVIVMTVMNLGIHGSIEMNTIYREKRMQNSTSFKKLINFSSIQE